MGRREEFERQLEQAQANIDNLPPGAPEDLKAAMHREEGSISLELNNLYDDPETETE
ncbi:hypothetical protein FACS1894159_11990 [Bacteroidia bacterium]|nr:hypothetical protein FACS1894159_11990 [Bacteroidia bacterium]